MAARSTVKQYRNTFSPNEISIEKNYNNKNLMIINNGGNRTRNIRISRSTPYPLNHTTSYLTVTSSLGSWGYGNGGLLSLSYDG